MNARRILLITFCFHATIALAQNKPPAQKPAFSATRVAKAPAIDGDLSDAAWQNVPEITSFTQHNPDDGKPATQKTVVKVVYDDHAIYFGAMLYDTNPVTA